MKKRLSSILLTLIAIGFTSIATASYSAGKEYQKLPQQLQQNPLVAMQKKPGKVVVTEFFSYACPACNSVSKPLRQWVKSHEKDDVMFQRIPVVFHADWALFSRAFYIADVLGIQDKIDADLFKELHVKREMILTKKDLGKFFKEHGVSKEDFEKTYDSFAVNKAMEQAEMLRRAYKVFAIPTLIVNNEYQTDLSKSGSPSNFVEVLSFLVEKSRQA